MRRADRLFEILQILRRRQLTRARDLAERLEVSERTIYRDIRDLMASGVPVEGEAGVGYLLREGFDLPPLMFKEAEIEALVLGARIVESWADRDLAEAARDVLVKVEAVLPDRLKQQLDETALWAPADHFRVPIGFDPKVLRVALRRKQKLTFRYRNAEDLESRRKVRPLGLSFYGHIWLLSAWCELREDFRAFRLDRMEELEVLEETFVPEAGKTIDDYLKRERERGRDRHAAQSAPMAKTSPFSERVVGLLTPLGPVRSRAMFGGFGVYLDDVMFGLIAWDRLFFRTDDETKPHFADAGSEPFVYDGKGKAIEMPYWEAPAGSLADPEALLPWAELGLAAAKRVKAKKKPKKKRGG